MRGQLSLFGRQKDSQPTTINLALPSAVSDAIDGAFIVGRPAGEEGVSRVVVQLHGWSGFHYSDEGAAKVLARMFPDMNDRQLAQAVRRLGTRVRAHLRAQELTLEPALRPWKDRY